ncbi:MAG: filamentous hemagglutinin N-terminal domain-containing protein [Geminicoccales bacterium]
MVLIMFNLKLNVTVIGFFFISHGAGMAQVSTDGTVGNQTSLNGPDYDIGADLGTQAGDNLFHSFDEFSIGTGESAIFSGPGNIENVISRVTGGDVSSIDGRIASTIPGASLWLFNPAGVIFGANASLDVTGSFHVSTADELRTVDGGVYSAVNPSGNGLSVAAPESFGFLGADPAGITIAGSQLSVGDGETLSVVGGDVDIASAGLGTAGGALNILAASGPAHANLASGEITGAADGAVTVRDGSVLASAGDGGGKVRIEGGAFVVDDASLITSVNTGDTDGDLGIDIDVSTASVDGASRITTEARANGRGGDVAIAADGLQVIDGSIIASSAFGAGDGGNIDIASDTTVFQDGGAVLTTTVGSGDGGVISVAADDLLLSGGNLVTTTGETASGDSGQIVILAGSLVIQVHASGQRSAISSVSQGSGDTGNIDVRGDRVLLDGGNLLNGAAIQTLLEGDSAGGGLIKLVVGSLDLVRGGVISAESSGNDDGVANIDVTAGRILIDGGSSADQSLAGIALDSGSQGETPGAIVIRAGELDLRNGGFISTNTANEFDAGNIILELGSLSVSGGSQNQPSQITSGTFGTATGNGGQIVIVADNIDLNGNGTIRGNTVSEGDAGTIDIIARNRLDLRDGGSINTNTEPGATGDAGSISIVAGDLTITGPSEIASNTFGSGAGGSIDITANSARLDAENAGDFGGIATQGGPGSSGDAGSITLAIGDLTLLRNAQINSSTFGSGNAGSVSVTSGVITIDALQSNPRFLTGIATTGRGGGDGGTIDIAADRLILLGEEAAISSANLAAGSAGTIDIQLTEGLVIDDGFISTFSESGGGGGITIDAGEFVTVNGDVGLISTDVTDDTGNAGDIVITTPVLAVGDANILARADAGSGGDIQITADNLILSPDANINAEAGATGVDGTIAVSVPETDLTGGLVAFGSQFLDVSSLLRERCAVRRDEASSFTLGTGGSLPADLDAPVLTLLETGSDKRSPNALGRRTALVIPCPKSAS